MIRNARQYKRSRSWAQRLSEALVRLEAQPLDSGVNPHLRELEVEALSGQLAAIEAEISEYEALVESPPLTILAESIYDLPEALIRARIAAGLTHRTLADRLGLQEQAIQRYESTNYSSASFERLTEVAEALGVEVRHELHFSDRASTGALLRRLGKVGIARSFLEQRFLPAGESLSHLRADRSERLVDEISRVFGWSSSDLRETTPLEMSPGARLVANFKKPANANEESVQAYAVYAHHIALRVADLVDRPLRLPPRDWVEARSQIMVDGQISLWDAVNYSWDCGIAVVPLQDSIAIHGVFWNFGDRAAIVIKQNMRTESRWLFDLLHELHHAATNISGVLEGATQADSDAEWLANQFAADVLLNGRSEELVAAAVEEASNDIRRLKGSARAVASRENVPLGLFANVLAWRLSPENNWWGAAANLQETDEDPWEVCRDVLLQRADLSRLAEPDRILVLRALRDDGDVSDV